MSDYIDLHTASSTKYLPIGKRQLARMCEQRLFKTAFKPGTGGKTSKWLISRAEVVQWRINGHANPQY